MKKLTKKQAELNAKKELNCLIKVIKEQSYKNIKKALNSGGIDEKSEFMEANCLLALTILEDSCKGYRVKSGLYRQEAENIQKFI